MPDQNQTDPNSPQPVIPTVDPIIPTVLPVVPAPDSTFQIPDSSDVAPMPDFMNQGSPDSPVPPENSSPVQQPTVDSGSAAPAEFPSMVSAPKKKFGGGKLIATILGILVLVGGVGTGVYLTQQQQQLNSEATARVVKEEKTATEKKAIAVQKNQETMAAGGKSGLSDQQISNYTNDVNVYNNNHPDTTVALTLTTASITASTDQGTCGKITNATWCEGNDANGKHYGVCAGGVGCNTAISAAGYTVVIAAVQCIKNSDSSCTSNDNSSTKASTDAKCAANCNYFGNEAYICAQGVNASNGCGANNGTKIGSVPKCFCGTIQVDTGSGFVSYSSQCGCGGGGGTTPTAPPVAPIAPLVVPTAPPTLGSTAVCQNVKAYSSTWVALTSAQLSALAPATVINFCVVGSATAGIFDKAQFTINGVAQAETTIQRPSTQDYCQNYTIPAGVSAFNVTAKIHHATLGWK